MLVDAKLQWLVRGQPEAMNEKTQTDCRITREAAAAFQRWTARFADELYQSCVRLGDSREGLVDSDALSEAVRLTCIKLADEDSARDKDQSGGKVPSAA